LTACHDLQSLMNTTIVSICTAHLPGESATHPLVRRFGLHTALLLLVGTSPLRRHALPAPRLAGTSGAFNCRI